MVRIIIIEENFWIVALQRESVAKTPCRCRSASDFCSEGALTLDAVRQLRHDDRKLTYTRQQADKSIICRKEVITKEQFIDLIQDVTVQILF